MQTWPPYCAQWHAPKLPSASSTPIEKGAALADPMNKNRNEPLFKHNTLELSVRKLMILLKQFADVFRLETLLHKGTPQVLVLPQPREDIFLEV